jgi:hypothetical protein
VRQNAAAADVWKDNQSGALAAIEGQQKCANDDDMAESDPGNGGDAGEAVDVPARRRLRPIPVEPDVGDVQLVPLRRAQAHRRLQRPAQDHHRDRRLRPELWQSAKDVLRQDGGSYETCLIHRYFQHFNFLWTSGRLTSVVDWGAASIGPAALDVGHCRLNLAVLFGAEWAERLRLAYEAETGGNSQAAMTAVVCEYSIGADCIADAAEVVALAGRDS